MLCTPQRLQTAALLLADPPKEIGSGIAGPCLAAQNLQAASRPESQVRLGGKLDSRCAVNTNEASMTIMQHVRTLSACTIANTHRTAYTCHQQLLHPPCSPNSNFNLADATLRQELP